MRSIVKKALARFKTRPLEKYVKPVDAWEDRKPSPILAGTTVAIKPQSAMSVMSNTSTGIQPLTSAQIASIHAMPVTSYTYNNIGTTGISAQAMGSIFPGTISGSTYNSSYGTITAATPTHIASFHNNQNKEIVRLNTDGTVTWADGATEDEAAQAFSRAMTMSGEMCAGITYGVKQRIRDAAFEELIDMAKTKGSLTADDLTYMLQAAKMMDKLKGIK